VSGVGVDLSAFHPSQPYKITVCLNGKCAYPLPNEDAIVIDDRLSSTDPVLVVLSVDGVVQSTARVPLRKQTPNGPNCSPTTYYGHAHATADGTLVVDG